MVLAMCSFYTGAAGGIYTRFYNIMSEFMIVYAYSLCHAILKQAYCRSIQVLCGRPCSEAVEPLDPENFLVKTFRPVFV